MKNARNAELNTAISIASYVIRQLHDDYLNIESWFEYYDVLPMAIEKWSKPSKQTLVHEYIKMIYLDDQNYTLDKHFTVPVIKEIQKLLEYYNINYSNIGILDVDELDDLDCDETIEEYAEELQSFFVDNLLDIIVDDVFTILYADKNFMYEFNRQCSEIIATLKQKDYPDLLKADGIIKRIDYYPEWLKNGIFYRDKGRCSLCGCDLTGVFNIETSKNYDHIIPLKRGGNNDPSNLQLTCETCNKSKGAKNSNFKNIIFPFW